MEKTMGRAERVRSMGKGAVILRVALATALFSVFLKIDALVQVGNILVDWAWPAVPVLLGITLVRMLLAATVVLAVLPVILGVRRLRDWLPGYVRIDSKAVLLGLLSFVVFCVLAAVISLSMGIYRGDLSAAFARPALYSTGLDSLLGTNENAHSFGPITIELILINNSFGATINIRPE